MDQPKTTLYDMAEAVGEIARSHRIHVEIYDREHSSDPIPEDGAWVVLMRTFEAAHLTLALMATDPDASRKFIGSLVATDDGKAVARMLASAPRKSFKPAEDAAA